MTSMLRNLGVGVVLALEGFVNFSFTSQCMDIFEPMTRAQKRFYLQLPIHFFLGLGSLSRTSFPPNAQH